MRHAGLEDGVVLVTSPDRAEGRTTLAYGLGEALAAGGSRVLLVDADLRSPDVGEDAEPTRPVGLTDVLAGRVPVRDAIRSTLEHPFDVLGSGSAPSNPSELVSSQQLADLLEELRRRYDVLLIDSPPLLGVSDAAELAALADCTILVCRHGRTRKAHLRAGVTALSAVSARLVGTVLTMTRRPQRTGEHPATPPQPADRPILAGTLRPYRVPHPRHGEDQLVSRTIRAGAVRHAHAAPADNPNHHAHHH